MALKHFYTVRFFLSITLVGIVLLSCSTTKTKEAVGVNPWKKMALILDSIKAPQFPNKNYSITDFGAQSGGVMNAGEAFKKAINACTKNGGGKVIVPAGKFLTGPIHLEDNVNLHLEQGAEIVFSTNPKEYPLVHTSWEGTELMNYSPLIYAYQKRNVAVTGKGVLNGQANNENWWWWCSKKEYGWEEGKPNQNDPLNRLRLIDLAEKRVPVEERIFGEGHYLRPNFVEFFDCKNVLLKDVKIINAPFWIVHPIKSVNVTIDGITVESHGPNNDGCDPEYSKNVLIKNCLFNTGDDCIAIKSGRDADGRRVAMKSQNIIVQNCKMIDGHGGVVIGSEISGGVSNVFVENCVMDSPNLDRAIRIKTNSNRGGLIENVFVRNLKVGQVKEAVLKLNMFYEVYGAKPGTFIPQIQNIHLENITVQNGGMYGILAKGYEQSPIRNVTLKNVKIIKVKEAFSIENLVGLKLSNTFINGVKVEAPTKN
jgi:polygalacturonase